MKTIPLRSFDKNILIAAMDSVNVIHSPTASSALACKLDKAARLVELERIFNRLKSQK